MHTHRFPLPLLFFTAILFAAVLSALPTFADGASSTATPAAGTCMARPATRIVLLTGFTRARTTMTLVSEVAARCLSVSADVGDTLGSDGVFARLDGTFLRLELAANTAEQDKLTSQMSYWTREVKRYQELVSTQSAAQSQLDRLEQDLDQARLSLRVLTVQSNTLRERLARHTVSGPSGWQVIRRDVEPGEWVGAGAVLAELGDFRTLHIPFALAAEEYEWLRASGGAPSLTVTASDGRRTRVRTHIAKVSPAFDEQTRKINVELAITPESAAEAKLGERRGGLRAEMDAQVPDPGGAVLVDPACVTERYDEYWLERRDGGKVRAVVLGPGPDGSVRVSSDEIRAGDVFRILDKTDAQ